MAERSPRFGDVWKDGGDGEVVMFVAGRAFVVLVASIPRAGVVSDADDGADLPLSDEQATNDAGDPWWVQMEDADAPR